MTLGLSRCIATLLICGFLIPANAPAQARPQAALEGVGVDSKTTLVVATLIAAVALIGVGVYFAIRQGRSVKGCVAEDRNGLELQTEGGQSFVLLGATIGIRSGERVKLTGSRKKKVTGVSDKPSFVVDKLDKQYGPCTISLSHP
jgi:hypothetical protein